MIAIGSMTLAIAIGLTIGVAVSYVLIGSIITRSVRTPFTRPRHTIREIIHYKRD